MRKTGTYTLIKNQIYLATHQIGFWISSLVLLGYIGITFVYYCFNYYGMDAASTLDSTDMYAFDELAPFWDVFIIVIPIICALNFGYQNSENRKNGVYGYVSLKVTAGQYWTTMAWANAILTFVQFEIAALLSMFFNRITFADTGVFWEGIKGSAAYWKNVSGIYQYHLQDLHIEHPWLHLFLFSLIFSVFCAGISHFLYAISLYIKKNGLWIFVVAAGVSFVFQELYIIGDYNIWGDVTVATTCGQSGVMTAMIWVFMLVVGTGCIKSKCIRWEHEE